MKKLYTRLATALCALLVATATMAQTRAPQTPVGNLMAPKPGTVMPEEMRHRIFNEAHRVTPQQFGLPDIKAANGKSLKKMIQSGQFNPAEVGEDINSFNWVAMDGKAKFHDDLGNVIFNLGVLDYETPILTATDSPETYALGPYNSSYPYYKDIKESGFISSQAGYLWLHANDHAYVTFPIFATGWLWADNTPIYLCSYAWVMEFQGHDKELVKNAGLGGVNDGGHIYFPCKQSVAFTIDGENFYYIDDDGEYGFCLPGVEVNEEDNQIHLSTEAYCWEDNQVVVHMKAGRNIKIFKYGFYQAFTEDIYDDVIENGAGGQYVDEGNITLDLQGDVKGNRCLYFAVVAGTEQGIIKDADMVEIYLHPNDDDDWITDGQGQYTEGLVHHIYTDITSSTYAVTVQHHKDAPGYYRLVNPYHDESGWNKPQWAPGHSDHNHNHYLFIDATDPDGVVLECTPLGLTIDNSVGEARVTSEAHERIKYEGATLADVKQLGLTGKLDKRSGTITFPAKKLWYSEAGYNNGQWYTTNKTGNFALTLPSTQGIEVLDADADCLAPVEYFNLQGQKVSTPAPGQMLIRRQGTRTEKVTF